MSEEGNPQEIIVKVKKEEPQQNHLEELERLKQENDELTEKIQLIAEKAFEKKKAELGCNDDTVNDPESLMAWEKGRKSANQNNLASGGVAPLSQGQGQEVGFGSYPEMIDAIRDKASPQNSDLTSRREAQKVLDAIMLKAFRGQEEARKPFSYAPKADERGTLETLRDKYQRRKKIARGLE